MFIVMFEFVVKDGCKDQFLAAWPKVTQGIYLFKGSLGSRLHRDKNDAFIAYAQWPNEETYRKASNIEMSENYEKQRQLMHESLNLESTRTIHKMEVEIDYLHRRRFDV